MRTALACLLAVTTLSACQRAPDAVEPGPAPDPGVSEGEPAAAQTPPHPLDPNGGLAPALVAPGGNDDQSRPPSYEVAIASAAASHNKALTRCTEQPQAVRTQCEQEANAAFAEAQTSLAPLRGNPE